MIKMNAVQSSNVVAIGHDGNETMRVEYRGDSFYNFEGVTPEGFEKLKKAKSVGSFLHKMNVRGTKIITSKCEECGKVAMIKIESDGYGDGESVDCWQCQKCGCFKPF